MLFLPQNALAGLVGTDALADLGRGLLLLLGKETAEIVGVIVAKGIGDLLDRKLRGTQKLNGVGHLVFGDILHGCQAKVLFKEANKVLG